MFTGIVETVGEVTYLKTNKDYLKLRIKPKRVLDDLKIGDSIAVNGICLTITQLFSNTFSVEVVPETLRKTNLNSLSLNNTVNLERSLKLSDRISGHYVQGHVDFCGEIRTIRNDGEKSLLIQISYPAQFTKYIISKGYITIDGMSITIIDVLPNDFSVTFIPHTQEVTIINHYQIGTKVNIEIDILGKYIEKLIGFNPHA